MSKTPTTRAVRVLTEVGALDRELDYETTIEYEVGHRLRVPLKGRSVRAWVTGPGELSAATRSVKSDLGVGPPASLVELAQWASWRWSSPRAKFLVPASPTKIVRDLPTPPSISGGSADAKIPPGPILVGPLSDPLEVINVALTRVSEGATVLVLVPTDGWANRLVERLSRRGYDTCLYDRDWSQARAQWPVVVGTRSAAFAPCERMAAAVLIDADDESYRQSSAPTWSALDVVRERCRRDDAPLWMTSVAPSPILLHGTVLHQLDDVIRAWPQIDIVDRRHADPHEGVLSSRASEHARAALDRGERVAVIHQRLGEGRLIVCRRCGALARCSVCARAERDIEGLLECPSGHGSRERFCTSCHSTGLRRADRGVTTLARDIALQLHSPVTPVTARQADVGDDAQLLVGTEALFTRVRRVSVVIFSDFDHYLLAPRSSARRGALLAVAKAGRLVKSKGGVVVLQTRRGDDDVITALRTHDVAPVITDDLDTARELRLAPFGAMARIRGGDRDVISSSLSRRCSVNRDGDELVVRADSVVELCDALSEARELLAESRVAVE